MGKAIINARELSQKELYVLRRKIIKLLQRGHSTDDVAAILAVSKFVINTTMRNYAENGMEGLKLRGSLGRRFGEKRVLTP